MSELQHQTDVEAAKEKLREVAETKEGRKDPRGGELITRPAPRPPVGEKKIAPVSGKPKKKKFGKKLKEALFSEDIGNGSVTEYLFFKLFVPSVKRLLSDMANSAINMALGLDPKTRTIQSNTHVSNASVYRDRNYNRGYSNGEYSRRDAISELEWDGETANDIYVQILDILERYPDISIMDVYSIMGLGDRVRTTDNKWGWTSPKGIEKVCIDPVDDRWIIDMPPARPLSRN